MIAFVPTAGKYINIGYLDALGNHGAAQGVPLMQEGEDSPNQRCCTWMPYQVGQAKKDAAPSGEVKPMTPAELQTTIRPDPNGGSLVGGVHFDRAPADFYPKDEAPVVLPPYPGKDGPTLDSPFGWGRTPDGKPFRKASEYDVGN